MIAREERGDGSEILLAGHLFSALSPSDHVPAVSSISTLEGRNLVLDVID